MAENFPEAPYDDLNDDRIAYWPPGHTGELGEDRFRCMGAIDAFLGTAADMPSYDLDYGFRIGSHSDTSQARALIAALEPLKHRVPVARGYQALTRLFLAIVSDHNPDALAEAHQGLREFFLYPEDVWNVVEVFKTVHADLNAWPRIASLVFDYAQWMAKQIGKPPAEIGQYIPREIKVLGEQRQSVQE